MDLRKPIPKGAKMNYEDYDLPENKNTMPDLPPNKENMQQPVAPIQQQAASNVPIKKEIQISQQTKERADACKLYVESWKFFLNFLEIAFFLKKKNRKIHQTETG